MVQVMGVTKTMINAEDDVAEPKESYTFYLITFRITISQLCLLSPVVGLY